MRRAQRPVAVLEKLNRPARKPTAEVHSVRPEKLPGHSLAKSPLPPARDHFRLLPFLEGGFNKKQWCPCGGEIFNFEVNSETILADLADDGGGGVFFPWAKGEYLLVDLLHGLAGLGSWVLWWPGFGDTGFQ